MSTLTIRLPDDKHARLRQLAKHRDISVNKLVEELATISIAEFDAESRFRALAARGTAAKGLAILDKLDAVFAPETGKAGADAKTAREKQPKEVMRKAKGQ
jgi:predicted transcriptional regulator